MNTDDTRRDLPSDLPPDGEIRKSSKTSIEHRKTVSETEEIHRTHGGRYEKRISTTETSEHSVKRTESYETGPGPALPGPGLPADWHTWVPERVRLTIQQVVGETCPDGERFDGDYLLKLVARQADECRWELSFPALCRLYRASFTARPSTDGLQFVAAFEGSVPGPRWTVTGPQAVDRTFTLRWDATSGTGLVAGCRWPESISIMPIAAAPETGYLIPSRATAGELAAMAAQAGSGSSCPPGGVCDFTPPCEDDEECCDCACSEPPGGIFGSSPLNQNVPGSQMPLLSSSAEPVRYFNGEVQLEVTDLAAPGYGKLWQQRRVYSNRISPLTDVGNGYGWLVESWPYLTAASASTVTVVRGTRKTLWFDLVGGVYVGRFGAKSTLIHDEEENEFVLTLPSGEQYVFHDFDQSAAPPGMFARQITRGGQVTEVTSYSGSGRIEEMQRNVTVDSSVHTESFQYSYSGGHDIESLILRRKVDSGSWTNIRRVAVRVLRWHRRFWQPGGSQAGSHSGLGRRGLGRYRDPLLPLLSGRRGTRV
jgi:hypothetical protein